MTETWTRGNAYDCGKGLAICRGTEVLARVTGNGYPIGIGNDPESDRVANLMAAAPYMLDTLEDFAAWEPDEGVSVDNLAAWVRERAKQVIAKVTI